MKQDTSRPEEKKEKKKEEMKGSNGEDRSTTSIARVFYVIWYLL